MHFFTINSRMHKIYNIVRLEEQKNNNLTKFLGQVFPTPAPVRFNTLNFPLQCNVSLKIKITKKTTYLILIVFFANRFKLYLRFSQSINHFLPSGHFVSICLNFKIIDTRSLLEYHTREFGQYI